MPVNVEFVNEAGRLVAIEFGDEFEEAVKYCRTRGDSYRRVLIPFCEECEKRISEEDLPNGQNFSLMCRDCFGWNCSSLEEGGWAEWVEEAAQRAGFKTTQGRKVEFMVQSFYDYLEKHDLPSVTLGEDEDIILLDQTPAVRNSPDHLEWFNNFYALWNDI